MKLAALLLGSFALVFPLAAPGSERPGSERPVAEPPVAGGNEQMALMADFVEVGRVDRSLPRDIAMVDLVNLSPHVLDVIIGDGAATLQPKERLIARVKSGDQLVTVNTREKTIAPMEGRLRLDSGLRYELALAYGAVPHERADMALPGIDPDGSGGADIAPRPPGGLDGAAQPPSRPRAEPPRRGKGGKVDVGRRR